MTLKQNVATCVLVVGLCGVMGGCSDSDAAMESSVATGGEPSSNDSSGDAAVTGGSGTGPGPTPRAPTFTAIYEEVLVNQCSGPICHSGPSGGNLIMTSKEAAYEALVNVPAEGVTLPGICEGMPPNCGELGLMRVAPNDPDASLLLDKVANTPPRCGCPMPTSPPALSDAAVQQIRTWIMAGAPND